MQGRMAEWSKALVLGTSLSGGEGSNPACVIFFIIYWHVFILFFYIVLYAFF